MAVRSRVRLAESVMTEREIAGGLITPNDDELEQLERFLPRSPGPMR
jgi:hypothetical protein